MSWNDFEEGLDEDRQCKVRVKVTYQNSEYVPTLSAVLDDDFQRISFDDIEELPQAESHVQLFDIVMAVGDYDPDDAHAYRYAHYEEPVARVRAALTEFADRTGVLEVDIKPVF
jgi:hypothetical protein